MATHAPNGSEELYNNYYFLNSFIGFVKNEILGISYLMD
jgi:hypothetical protein